MICIHFCTLHEKNRADFHKDLLHYLNIPDTDHGLSLRLTCLWQNDLSKFVSFLADSLFSIPFLTKLNLSLQIPDILMDLTDLLDLTLVE